MKPSGVNKSNEAALWKQQYVDPYMKREPVKVKYKLQIGDTVRISYLRRTFSREYEDKWTNEIFKVKRRFVRQGLPIYKLQDYQNEDLQGTFYEQELQLIKEPELYRIEKILRTQKVKGKKRHLVRWYGWSSKFDTWIDARDLQEYEKS